MGEQRHLVVVTGADGFIGRALRSHWQRTGRPFRALVRRRGSMTAPSAESVAVGDLATASDDSLDAALAGATAIVHLAGRAHVMDDLARDPAAAYHAANVEATVRLARAAVRVGIERFILASSIKVNGESSPPGRPFGPADPPAPADDYARSKWEAERQLAVVATGTALVPVTLRLPLVYGPGVGANFLALIDAVARRRRLPLAAVRARRSLLYVGNLATAVDAALDALPSLQGVHCLADATPVAMPDLVRMLGVALGVPARLIALPAPLLQLAARITGREAAIRRLTTALEVDSTSFRQATGWTPPATMDEGLADTVRWWKGRHSL